MRYKVLAVTALALGACAPHVGVSPQETVTPDAPETTIPTELATIHPAYVTAWSSTEASPMQVYFEPDVVVVTPTGRYTTWTAVAPQWVTPLLSEHYAIAPTRFVKTGDHSITETGSYNYMMDHNGTPMQMKGTYTYHWKKGDDGVWRIKDVDLK